MVSRKAINIKVPAGERDNVLRHYDSIGGTHLLCLDAHGNPSYGVMRFVIDGKPMVPEVTDPSVWFVGDYTRASAILLLRGAMLSPFSLSARRGHGGQANDQGVFAPVSVTVERLKS